MLKHKTCSRCERVLPLEAFWKNRRRRDGLESCCRECRAEDYAEWYAANRERKAEYMRSLKSREYQAQWGQANPEKRRAKTARHAARKLSIPCTLTPAEEVALRLSWRKHPLPACVCCNEVIELDQPIHLEHLIPVSRPECNPTHSLDNVGPAHAWCNQQKHDSTLAEFHGFIRSGEQTCLATQ
jgi:hypothetical protein